MDTSAGRDSGRRSGHICSFQVCGGRIGGGSAPAGDDLALRSRGHYRDNRTIAVCGGGGSGESGVARHSGRHFHS